MAMKIVPFGPEQCVFGYESTAPYPLSPSYCAIRCRSRKCSWWRMWNCYRV